MDSTVCLLPDRTTETTLQETCQMSSYLAMDYFTLDYACVYEVRTIMDISL
jgi:hypothetical protein